MHRLNTNVHEYRIDTPPSETGGGRGGGGRIPSSVKVILKLQSVPKKM